MTQGKRPRDRSAAQQRLAAKRAAEEAARASAARRKRLLTVFGPVVAIIVVIGGLIAIKAATGSGGPKSGTGATPADPAVVAKVTNVPAATLDKIGVGTVQTKPIPVSAPPLTADNGKPRILYVGAEYCPYCAAERWPMVVALSRFGTFSGLMQTESSPSDVYPKTQTLSFHGSTFTSAVLVFNGYETTTNQVKDGQYTPLDKLSSADEALVTKYDAPPYVPKQSAGAIPFVLIGGKYLISGASYDPGVLKGKTHQQIADALADPNTAIAKAVNGTANVISAAICAITNDAPASVCQSAGVRAGAAALSSSSGTTGAGSTGSAG